MKNWKDNMCAISRRQKRGGKKMKKRILSYRKQVDALLEDKTGEKNWNEILEEHLIQIGFFQHERLIHLIVTVVFAILTLLSFGILLLTTFLPVMALCVLFLILLIPYIGHYYLLENEVQKMYIQYDEIWKRVRMQR